MMMMLAGIKEAGSQQDLQSTEYQSVFISPPSSIFRFVSLPDISILHILFHTYIFFSKQIFRLYDMLTPLKMKEKAKHIVYIFIWHVVKYCVSRIFPSVDDEKVCSKGGEDKGGVGKESNPPNPPGMV